MSTVPVAVTYYTCPNCTVKDFPFSDVETNDEDKTIKTTGHDDVNCVFQTL